MRGVDVVNEGGDKTFPFVQTQGNAFLRGFDGTVLRAVGLVPLSEVHALVARRHADVVTPTDVFAKVYIFVAFQDRRNGFVDGVYVLTKCCPSVTNTNTEGVSREGI